MHAELELLIKLHDLDIMIRDATEERYASEERDMGFVLRNLTSLQQAHDKLREQVSPETLRQGQDHRKYQKILNPDPCRLH